MGVTETHADGFFDGLFEAFDEDESDSIDEKEFLRLFSVMKLQATRTLAATSQASSPSGQFSLSPKGRIAEGDRLAATHAGEEEEDPFRTQINPLANEVAGDQHQQQQQQKVDGEDVQCVDNIDIPSILRA